MVGLMATSQAESTMASWVSTEYAAAGCTAGNKSSSARSEVAALLKPFRLFLVKPCKPDARRFPDIWTKNRLASLLYLPYPESLRRRPFSGGASGPQKIALKCGVRGMAIRL